MNFNLYMKYTANTDSFIHSMQFGGNRTIHTIVTYTSSAMTVYVPCVHLGVVYAEGQCILFLSTVGVYLSFIFVPQGAAKSGKQIQYCISVNRF